MTAMSNLPTFGVDPYKGVLECDDEFLAYRLGARAPTPALTNGSFFIVLPRVGQSLVWPFVSDDVKDLNRRTTA